jgi:hypothetical protein
MYGSDQKRAGIEAAPHRTLAEVKKGWFAPVGTITQHR